MSQTAKLQKRTFMMCYTLHQQRQVKTTSRTSQNDSGNDKLFSHKTSKFGTSLLPLSGFGIGTDVAKCSYITRLLNVHWEIRDK